MYTWKPGEELEAGPLEAAFRGLGKLTAKIQEERVLQMEAQIMCSFESLGFFDAKLR